MRMNTNLSTPFNIFGTALENIVELTYLGRIINKEEGATQTYTTTSKKSSKHLDN